MKKSTWVIFAFLLTMIALPLDSHAATHDPKMPAWRAEYFDNPSLSGHPKIVRADATVNQDWGLGSPALGIPKDHFSARWTTTAHLEEGSYLFILNVDDGARVWLNGRLIIDAWDIGGNEKVKAKVRLGESGDFEIQVAYFEQTGFASIHLEILQLGGEDDIVGAWRGEYFDNKDLRGEPVMTRQDGGVAFNWGFESPHPKVPRDNFSVRWSRSIYLKEGKYLFRVQHDDGMRIFVDGKIIYSSWFDQPPIFRTAVVPLKEGFRTFVVEFFDHVGDAVAQVQIEQDPGDYEDYDPTEDGAGVIVDNTSVTFSWSGPNRSTSLGGIGGDFFWTTNKISNAINMGRWKAPIGSPGNYEVFAYIPREHSSTINARYRIYHFGRFIDRRLDQRHFVDEFVSLGTYFFDGESEEFVVLFDSTGEAAGTTEIAFDALKFVKR